jgi:hypothetical protein
MSSILIDPKRTPRPDIVSTPKPVTPTLTTPIKPTLTTPIKPTLTTPIKPKITTDPVRPPPTVTTPKPVYKPTAPPVIPTAPQPFKPIEGTYTPTTPHQPTYEDSPGAEASKSTFVIPKSQPTYGGETGQSGMGMGMDGGFKKGGSVKSYTDKSGRINLGSGRVSTHTPSKKNSNW